MSSRRGLQWMQIVVDALRGYCILNGVESRPIDLRKGTTLTSYRQYLADQLSSLIQGKHLNNLMFVEYNKHFIQVDQAA